MAPINREQISLYEEAKAGISSLIKQTALVFAGLIAMLLVTRGSPSGWLVGFSFVVGVAFVAWLEKRRLTKKIQNTNPCGGNIVNSEPNTVRIFYSASTKQIDWNYEVGEKNEILYIYQKPLDWKIFKQLSRWYLVRKIHLKPTRARNLNKVDLTGVNLSGAILTLSDLRGAILNGAKLRGADLRGAELNGTKLRGADLRNANLSRANLSEDYLWEAELIPATLSEADLSRDGLKGADLRGADLRGAILSRANFCRFNFREVDLREAILNEANLIRANLIRANLIRANLSGVNLSRADLSGANLSGANLSGANLSGAKVNKARFGGNLGISEEMKNDLIKRGAIFEDTLGDRGITKVPSGR